MDELLQLLLGQVVQLHLQSERLLCDGLVRRVVVLDYSNQSNWSYIVWSHLFQIGVGESVLNHNPLVRVERQHLLKEVKSLQELADLNLVRLPDPIFYK